MIKPADTGPFQRGDMTYLHEKLGQAIGGAIFADSPEAISSVFEVLSRVFDGYVPWDQSVYVKGNPDAEKCFRRIKELITPSAGDEKDSAAASRGTFWVRAQRMSVDERHDLARCMWELYHHVGRVGVD